MAVSGSKNYTVTRADIIEAAYRKLGIYDAGETIDGPQTDAASLALNLMTKEWVTRGADIWLRDEITVFLQPDTRSYALGTDNVTRSFVETTLGAAEASGQTVITVTSSAGMTAADFIGIKMDDDTIHWTTIVSVDDSTTVTITAATDDDAASGNKVYAYTTKATRPTKIVSAYRRDKNGIDTVIDMVGEEEYRSLSNKGSSGPPVLAWYQPTLTTGTLYVWPVDGGANWDKIYLSAQYYADDFDAANDNPQFPIEWANALIWGLAAELASEHGLTEREQSRLWSIAENKLNHVLDFDVENASVEFGLEYRL
jgi:hypothetical protein